MQGNEKTGEKTAIYLSSRKCGVSECHPSTCSRLVRLPAGPCHFFFLSSSCPRPRPNCLEYSVHVSRLPSVIPPGSRATVPPPLSYINSGLSYPNSLGSLPPLPLPRKPPHHFFLCEAGNSFQATSQITFYPSSFESCLLFYALAEVSSSSPPRDLHDAPRTRRLSLALKFSCPLAPHFCEYDPDATLTSHLLFMYAFVGISSTWRVSASLCAVQTSSGRPPLMHAIPSASPTLTPESLLALRYGALV